MDATTREDYNRRVAALRAARRECGSGETRIDCTRIIYALSQAANDVEYFFAAAHGAIPGSEGSYRPPVVHSYEEAVKALSGWIYGPTVD